MSDNDYWKKREERNLVVNKKIEAEYDKTISSYYSYMMDQCQKEINGFYSKYASKEGITLSEAKRRIQKTDIEAYGRKAAKYVREKNFSDQANQEMRLYNATMKINRLEMLKANIGLELVDGFDGLQKYFDKILTDRTLSEFERQAGILGATIGNNNKKAAAIVNASFNNATYSDRIWMYQDMMKSELSKLLQQGLIQGKNPKQLATHLQKLFGVRKSDAQRLMRTELARVQIEAQRQSFERNGYEYYQFLALGTACEICKDLDGKHFKVKDMMPGENAPPMHPNCRCSVAAWDDSDDYEAWLDYLDKGGTTEEWEKLKNSNKYIANSAIQGYTRFRKKSNAGTPFDQYSEPMQHKHVNNILKDMGIDFGGARIRIIRDERLIGTGYYGWTSPDQDEIQLYPDAFENREQLVKTLGHERIHLEQIRKWGQARDSEESVYYEKGPKFSEEYWWSEYQKKR